MSREQIVSQLMSIIDDELSFSEIQFSADEDDSTIIAGNFKTIVAMSAAVDAYLRDLPKDQSRWSSVLSNDEIIDYLEGRLSYSNDFVKNDDSEIYKDDVTALTEVIRTLKGD